MLLVTGLALYTVFATLDGHLTVTGMAGDVALEGNPFLRYLMAELGIVGGLVFCKVLVLGVALSMAAATLSLPETRINGAGAMVMSRAFDPIPADERRYRLACLPLYVLALAQCIAATFWLYLLGLHGLA